MKQEIEKKALVDAILKESSNKYKERDLIEKTIDELCVIYQRETEIYIGSIPKRESRLGCHISSEVFDLAKAALCLKELGIPLTIQEWKVLEKITYRDEGNETKLAKTLDLSKAALRRVSTNIKNTLDEVLPSMIEVRNGTMRLYKVISLADVSQTETGEMGRRTTEEYCYEFIPPKRNKALYKNAKCLIGYASKTREKGKETNELLTSWALKLFVRAGIRYEEALIQLTKANKRCKRFNPKDQFSCQNYLPYLTKSSVYRKFLDQQDLRKRVFCSDSCKVMYSSKKTSKVIFPPIKIVKT